MKQKFIDFIQQLMDANPQLTNELMTEEIKEYLTSFINQEVKPEITENGKLILGYLQKSSSTILKAKDIAEGLYINSRGVPGAMRKLANDGFVEKIGQNPALYTLTEKGKNYNIKENE